MTEPNAERASSTASEVAPSDGSAVLAQSPATDARASGPGAMWRHIIGEASTTVGKLARVRAPKGVRLRTRAAPDQPDLNRSAGADRVVAEHYYGKQFRDGRDARLYVQALYEANKSHKGIYLTEVQLDRSETLPRGEDEEHTLEIYKGAKVREGHVLWVPSEAFIEQLRARGAITSGSSELSQAWRGAKAAVGHVIDAATYAAAFTVGLLEGAWDAIVELFQGAADMIELVAKTVYQIVTGNPGAIKATLMGWVDKLKGAWAGRDKLADAFMKKWESDDAWTRGNFQGGVFIPAELEQYVVCAARGFT